MTGCWCDFLRPDANLEKKLFVNESATPNWNVSACSFRSGLNLATTFVFYCDNFKESYWKKSWSDLSFVKSLQCTETFVVLVSSERISNRVFWLGFFSAAAASFIHVAHSAILLLVLPTLVWREKPYKSLKNKPRNQRCFSGVGQVQTCSILSQSGATVK